MQLKVLNYKNKVLRQKAKEIKEITPEIKRLALDMLETMEKERGLGLAAPQVDKSIKMIAVHLIADRSDDERLRLAPKILINPKIIKKSRQTETEEEGCLCAPGVFLKIKRAKAVEVEAQDINGNSLKIQAENLPARILQHEIDHLDGILFFDRLSLLEKINLKKKLKEE